MRYKLTAALIAFLTLTVGAYATGGGTYTQICKFDDYWPPNCPVSSLVMDAAGNLYGTSGYLQYSALNELSPAGDVTWTANQLYDFGLFSGMSPQPQARLAMDKDGNLYGTTFFGGLGTNQIQCYGEELGCGTVYELSPSANGWIETTLYYFQGLTADGGNPAGGVTLASPTRIIGTTFDQGAYGYGTVFELNYSKRNGWAEKTIYDFPPQGIGGTAHGPWTGALLKHGNLYGTTGSEIYELTKTAKGEWPVTVLYSADSPGIIDIMFGKDGNIYGTCDWCVSGGSGSGGDGGGQVFELAETDGQWTMTILHVFGSGHDGSGPIGGLVSDKSGNLYGQTGQGGVANGGTIFEMSKSEAGVWTETILRSFPKFNCAGVGEPTLLIDKSDNLYGADACGNTFEFRP